MLARISPSLVLKRGLKTEAISRFNLDINAHHNADQQRADSTDAVKRSAAAIRGQSLTGDVQLPRELQDAVTKAIEGSFLPSHPVAPAYQLNIKTCSSDADDKPGLRLVALDLYARLRSTAQILPPPASHRDRAALTTTYDAPTSLAYAAGLMPSVYGATLSALTTTRDRLKIYSEWEPDRMIDYGSGTGSAAWAFDAVWGPIKSDGSPREYVGLEGSRSMVELSSTLFGAMPQIMGEGTAKEGADGEASAGAGVKLDARAHQLPIPSSNSAIAKLQITPVSSLPGTGKKTIAICAFTLGDQGTKEKRKELVRAMWESGAEVIAIIERGTPGGSRMVIEAREQLLMYGKRNLSQEELPEGVVEAPRGSFVVAPCPHDGACPLHHSTRSYCHFSQRVRSPPFLRHTKHSTRGEDDAKFSYVVIQRGIRPAPSAIPDFITDELVDETLAVAEMNEEQQDSDKTWLHPNATPGDELQWPRLVAPPLKRSGHVILEVCAASGDLERHTIPRSQGKQAFYDARKSSWGDSFPHAPKNGPTPAPGGKEDDAAPVDKFGKDRSKLKSKKAMRSDKGEEMIPGRGERRKGREGKDRGGEVMDFDLEVGDDGELKIVK
ncbi:hypothetical protein P7C70_g117, partial [Phenoliferia sp. Uapishka_3]